MTLSSLIRESGDTWPYSVATVYAYRGERNEAKKADASRGITLAIAAGQDAPSHMD